MVKNFEGLGSNYKFDSSVDVDNIKQKLQEVKMKKLNEKNQLKI